MQKLIYSRSLRWALFTGLLFLVLMTLLRIVFVWFFHPADFSFQQAWPSFVLGLRFDLRIAAIIALTIWLITSIKPLNPFHHTTAKKFWLLVMSIATFIFCIFYGTDFAHYAYLSQRLNATVLNYLADFNISVNMMWQSYPIVRIIIAIIVILFLMRWVTKRLLYAADGEKQTATRTKRIITSVIVFLLLGIAIFGRVGQYPLRWSDAFTQGNDYKGNLALNPFQSFFSTLQFRKSTHVDIEAVKQSYPLMQTYLGLPSTNTVLDFNRTVTARDTFSNAKPNVVLVICESFSAYKSSMWGNPLNTTPFFNELCNKGIFFNHCFTPAYGTARGVWAAITGIPDVSSAKTASRNMAMVNQNTIINYFKGYEKFYFLGGSTSWANIRGLLVNNIEGLHLYEEGNYTSPRVDVWGISDKNLFIESNAVLKQQTKPFFAVIQTAGNHRPYTIPAEDQAEFKSVRFSEDSLKHNGFESNDELNAFRYSDYCFQKFFEAAQKESYFKNTVFVFVGDHGILGAAPASFPQAWNEGALTRLHVPLLFYSPQYLTPKKISSVCSQVDVLPSVASLLGIGYDNSSIGRNLFDTHRTHDTSSFFQSAFTYNADENRAGLMGNQYYYEIALSTGEEKFISMMNNNPVPLTDETKKWKAEAKALTKAIHETSGYLLLNNKRK